MTRFVLLLLLVLVGNSAVAEASVLPEVVRASEWYDPPRAMFSGLHGPVLPTISNPDGHPPERIAFLEWLWDREGEGVFTLQSDYWPLTRGTNIAGVPPGEDADDILKRAPLVSREIGCPASHCFLFGYSGGLAWLVTTDADYRVVAAELIMSSERDYVPKGGGSVGLLAINERKLETSFGGRTWHTDNPLDFEETGVFCSHYYFVESATPIAYDLFHAFKRRVTPAGVIEFKEIASWDECKLPW